MTNILSFRRIVLQEEFINIPSKFIDLTLKTAGNFYGAYLALELAEYTYSDTYPPPYVNLKAPRKIRTDALSRLDGIEVTGQGIPELKKEIQAARRQRKKQESRLIFLIVSSRMPFKLARRPFTNRLQPSDKWTRMSQ